MPRPLLSTFARSFFKSWSGPDSVTHLQLQQGNEENRCIFQGFEWHTPGDQKHWRRLEAALPALKTLGVNEIWLPPGCKATHRNSNGYDIYDLYDLGEFNQKGSRSTKWGSKEELLSLSNRAKTLGVGLIWDAVLGHRAGGDQKEEVKAVEVDPENRNLIISKPRVIEAWLRFDFSGRNDQHSSLKLRSEHFSGTDWDASLQPPVKGKIYLTAKRWCADVDTSEKGNYDFLMFSNLNYESAELRADVINWGANFLPSTLPALSGYRIDAARHFDTNFLLCFLAAIRRAHPNRSWTMIAEYWHGSSAQLQQYLRKFPRNHHIHVYDAPLLYAFHHASSHLYGKPRAIPTDLRLLLKDTIISTVPDSAVTLVSSHDTQPGQTLDCPVHPAFKEAAYAIILLHEKGLPCIFYGDLYGTQSGYGCEGTSPVNKLPDLILARKLFAYGRQTEYWDGRSCVGWTREGLDHNVPSEKKWMGRGCAVILSNIPEGGKKRMWVGRKHTGQIWTGLWEWERYKTEIDVDGCGLFEVGGCGVNVYVQDVAPGREQFGKFNTDIYSLC
ncbi:thermostable alpha-amylase [Lojkania enalia]|uniref:Thermostable alpha-amylase n=1 Tax=Lojkania enalia TaxID=147567 RepID=A0A9P4K589_9PLEO|nr:thermostable alpha-amylase [Didymosphaeria enalia]